MENKIAYNHSESLRCDICGSQLSSNGIQVYCIDDETISFDCCVYCVEDGRRKLISKMYEKTHAAKERLRSNIQNSLRSLIGQDVIGVDLSSYGVIIRSTEDAIPVYIDNYLVDSHHCNINYKSDSNKITQIEVYVHAFSNNNDLIDVTFMTNSGVLEIKWKHKDLFF